MRTLESAVSALGKPPVRHSRVHPLISLVVGLALYLVLPALVLPLVMNPIDLVLSRMGLLEQSAGAWERGFAAAMVLRWAVVPLLLLYVVAVEREPLSSLGIRRPPLRDVGLALVVGLAAFAIGEALYLLVHGPGVDAGTQIALIFGTLGVAGRLQVALNAAVVEELFFRGLLIERLIWLGASTPIAGVVSLVLFVGSHYLTGSSSLELTLTGDLVGGLALVGMYLLRRNLVTNTLAHAALNVYVVIG